MVVNFRRIEERTYAWSTFYSLCHASQKHKNVQKFKALLLAAADGERGSGVHSQMFTCQQIKVEHPTPSGKLQIFIYTRMEMGENYYGFCY